MARREIGQEHFSFDGKRSDLDDLVGLVAWTMPDHHLADISSASKGEAGWPPLCLLKALLLGRWSDDVKLADALDDRASFRRFCGFSRADADGLWRKLSSRRPT